MILPDMRLQLEGGAVLASDRLLRAAGGRRAALDGLSIIQLPGDRQTSLLLVRDSTTITDVRSQGWLFHNDFYLCVFRQTAREQSDDRTRLTPRGTNRG